MLRQIAALVIAGLGVAPALAADEVPRTESAQWSSTEASPAVPLRVAKSKGRMPIRGIDHLVLMGVTTQCCVHSTLRAAIDLGYWCLTLEDCCAAGSDAPFSSPFVLSLSKHCSSFPRRRRTALRQAQYERG